jgi:virulence factor Mce-like protein
VGLLTIAVVAAVGYVSYHALSGLPFQSYYDVSVTLPNADRLIATDDVRVGGVRVGQVAAVAAEPSRDGNPPYAVVRLQLSPSLGRLPVDTRVQVRPASVLGATYVALTLGSARVKVPPGGVLPLRQASSSVELTDLFQMFRGSAARNFQASTADFGAGLAGEGQSFNVTFGSLAALMGPLTVVSKTLASPATHLSLFISASDRAFSALSPVSSQLSDLFVGAARTFGAFADQRPSLASTIVDAPTAETSGTVALRRALPGLNALAGVMRALAPAAPQLSSGLETLNGALYAGIAPLNSSPPFARSLGHALAALGSISRPPSTSGGLRKLAQLGVAFRQMIDPLEQAQLHCNVFPLFAFGFSGDLGELGSGQGPALANIPIDNPGNSTDNEQSAAPARDGHINYVPTENASECAAGNEPVTNGTQDLTNPTGLPDQTRLTTPPPGALQRAAAAGLLAREAR